MCGAALILALSQPVVPPVEAPPADPSWDTHASAEGPTTEEDEAPHPPPTPVEVAATDGQTVAVPTESATPPVRLPSTTGRGFMIASIATGGAGWVFATGSAVLLARSEVDFDVGFQFAALTGLRWSANAAAMGLAIPAGILRGQYDATAHHLGQRPAIDARRYLVGGAVAIGVGSATWLTLRALVGAAFFRAADGESAAAYVMGVQTSWAVAAAGAGFLSYGLSYRARSDRLGPRATVRLLPQVSGGGGGLTIAGRF